MNPIDLVSPRRTEYGQDLVLPLRCHSETLAGGNVAHLDLTNFRLESPRTVSGNHRDDPGHEQDFLAFLLGKNCLRVRDTALQADQTEGPGER